MLKTYGEIGLVVKSSYFFLIFVIIRASGTTGVADQRYVQEGCVCPVAGLTAESMDSIG